MFIFLDPKVKCTRPHCCNDISFSFNSQYTEQQKQHRIQSSQISWCPSVYEFYELPKSHCLFYVEYKECLFWLHTILIVRGTNPRNTKNKCHLPTWVWNLTNHPSIPPIIKLSILVWNKVYFLSCPKFPPNVMQNMGCISSTLQVQWQDGAPYQHWRLYLQCSVFTYTHVNHPK